MIEEQHSDETTGKRGAQGVPRFIVALGIFGAVASVIALVAVVLTLSSGAPNGEGSADRDEGPAAGSTETSDDASSGLGLGTVGAGPSAAELAAKAAVDAEMKQDGDVAPADDEQPLSTLGSMPESTIGLIALPEGFSGVEYRVTFRPYGWGPGGPQAGNLVITVGEADLVSGDAKGVTPISGRNASVWVEADSVEILATGGEFAGTIEIRRQGNMGALFLSAVSRN